MSKEEECEEEECEEEARYCCIECRLVFCSDHVKLSQLCNTGEPEYVCDACSQTIEE